MPIGTPIAGPLVEIILRVVENQKFESFQPIMKLMQYIDDLLIVWKDLDRVDEFAEVLTMEQYSLKLKKDQESTTGIHFLDLQIEVDKRKFKTKVYRKPTYKLILIPNWSNDPMNYKKAVFQNYYKRSLTYCSEKKDLQ